jgi:Flp pilus assembly protein CpaB
MKRARIIVLAIALTAALGAAWMAKRMMSGPREVQEVEKTVGAVDVLVASKDINLGDSVGGEDVKWQEWPSEGVTPGLITRTSEPDAPSKLSGAIARAPFIAGEPIKEQKLIKISDPRDLLGPRAETPRPSERRDEVWDKYVKGDVTGSKWGPNVKPLSEHANASDVSPTGAAQ